MMATTTSQKSTPKTEESARNCNKGDSSRKNLHHEIMQQMFKYIEIAIIMTTLIQNIITIM